ncbi:MAG: methionyl-tRNA formyltransferase [Candidatus Doudnabacteria bacterium]|nr:methionyl-tRNA formyltransferase [Candidatus Doudnabacteria bacterium]
MQGKIKTLFIGTGEFAVPVLKSLVGLELVDLVGVVTQPDKPAGRKQELTPGPLKKALQEIPDLGNVQLFQPEKLREAADDIMSQTSPELIVVAAYGQMIPNSMLNTPKHKCLNLHGSLLPQLRGAVPVQMAILQGLSETGVTIQQMVKELDAGPILTTVDCEISPSETAESLMKKLADLGAALLVETLPRWVAGEIQPQEQDHSQATFCYQADIAKEKAEIRFETPLEQVERMVRAFYPWPVAWAKLDAQEGKALKIFKARIEQELKFKSNELEIRRDGKRLFLTLQNGVLELLEVQLEGKQRLGALDYLWLVNAK